MPRRSILSATERETLLALPQSRDDLIRYYTFSESDLSLIRQRRGAANRFGFAVQLCYMRFPGIMLAAGESPPQLLLDTVAQQLQLSPEHWAEYGRRDQTRREHLLELQTILCVAPFTATHYRSAIQWLLELAAQTDKGIVLAGELVEHLRRQSILLPGANVIERICSEAITRATRRIYRTLNEPLSEDHRKKLDQLLLQRKPDSRMTWLAWLRLSPGKPNSRQMVLHIQRLKIFQALDLPLGIDRLIHQNRLLKIAREGAQMTPADLAKFEPERRYATLVALATEGMATVIDEIVDLHDRIIGKLFNFAKKKHQSQFQQSGRSINDKVRQYWKVGNALLEAKKSAGDAFAAIESVMSWDAFTKSVAEAQKLAQPESFDFLHHLGEHYATLRRYAPELLEVLKLRAAPAAKNLIDAVDVIRDMKSNNARKMPPNAPVAFVKTRWKALVITDEGIDRRYYELCALSELRNALRSGDIWVQGSRQFKDFDEYLIPTEKYTELKSVGSLPLLIETDCDRYLNERRERLAQQL
jgi:hypothetical protein